MEVNKIVSVGKSSQSTMPKGVGILLVKDDLACSNIVAEMLRRCRHQELHTGGIFDVLNAIWETKDKLDLVLTNAYRLGSDGKEIIGHIQKRLRLPVTHMYLDERTIESKGQPFSFAAYVINDLSMDGVKHLWQIALDKEKHKMLTANQEEKVQRASISNVAAETNRPSSSTGDAARLNLKRKGVELSESSKDDDRPVKKPRVVWTVDMHRKFLDAIEILGYDKAVPKKIVEVMNIPGLTRENVASHLQKYRGNVKRTRESGTVFSSFPSRSTRTEFNWLGVPSSPSTSRLTSLQTYMTTFPLSSLMSTAKDTRKDFAFGTIPERKDYYMSLGDQQKHVPELQFTPNFGVHHDDPMKNMPLSIDGNSSSDQTYISKFVGIRVTSDGKSVEYANVIASTDNIVASSIQHDLISDQNQFMPAGGVSQQPSLLGSPAGETSCKSQSVREDENPTQSKRIGNLVQCNSGNEDTEKCCFSILDQQTSLQSREMPVDYAPLQNPSEKGVSVHDGSTPSSMCPCDQDFSMPPPLETPGNDFHVQSPAAFLEGISQSQQHNSPSPLPQMLEYFDEFFDQSANEDAQMKGTGSTSHEFDVEEFDDALFNPDD